MRVSQKVVGNFIGVTYTSGFPKSKVICTSPLSNNGLRAALKSPACIKHLGVFLVRVSQKVVGNFIGVTYTSGFPKSKEICTSPA